MLKFKPIFVFMFILSGMARGQEPVFYSQHMHNPMIYNPAFAGQRDIPGITLFSRQQWMGWDGSPSANLLIGHTRMKNKNAGLGVGFWYDRMGPVQHTGFSGAYSYTVSITGESRLMMGLQLELRVLQIRLSQLELVDQGDPLFSDDPGMKLQPNTGFGFNWVFRDYHVSLSVPKVLRPGLTPFQGNYSSWSITPRIIYVGAGSIYTVAKDLDIIPSLLAGFGRGYPPFLEIAGLLQYRKNFGIGALYRFNQTLGGMVRYSHNEQFEIGYSYDLSLSYTRVNAGTHELYLGYNFPFNRTKNLSPRRF